MANSLLLQGKTPADLRATDVSAWEFNAALSALRSGEMIAGPGALTCMLELM
jgi:hypothetical protein